jgi:hypothetical protein
MNPDQKLAAEARENDGYCPPTLTFLGTLAELTQKATGAADGATFLGVDLGDVS